MEWVNELFLVIDVKAFLWIATFRKSPTTIKSGSSEKFYKTDAFKNFVKNGKAAVLRLLFR